MHWAPHAPIEEAREGEDRRENEQAMAPDSGQRSPKRDCLRTASSEELRLPQLLMAALLNDVLQVPVARLCDVVPVAHVLAHAVHRS